MPKARNKDNSFVLCSNKILKVFWIINAPTNIAMPAKTFKIVLKKSRPFFIESACSAAASCAFITFKFSLSMSVISFLISLTSKLSSTTTFIKLTSPVESRSCCAVLNSNKAKVAPPAAKAESAIPTIVNVAGVAPAKTVTLSLISNSKFSAVTVSITTSFLFKGALPSKRVHCFA